MVSIARIVEKIIEERPFIQEALSKGIINNAALAEELIPEIEKEIKKEVKFSAVNLAIRRLSEKLETKLERKIEFNSETRITTRSNLIEVALYKTEKLQEKIQKTYHLIDYRKDDFLVITQGFSEVMIITDEKHDKEMHKIFKDNEIKKTLRNLSSITINIPENAVETIGLFYVVTRALNWNNINIIEIVSTLTEMTFILKEEDIPRAITTLSDLIKKKRKRK